MQPGDASAADELVTISSSDLADLRHKAAEFEALIGHFPDLYFRVDAEGRILDYRAGRSSELYLPPAVFIGRPIAELLPPEPGAQLQAAMHQAHASGQALAVEYTLPMPTGPERYEARLIPAVEPGPGDLLCFIRNVTAARKTYEELQRIVSLLRATLDATVDGILAVDRAGRIETLNRSFIDLWRIPDEVLATGDDGAALAFVVDQLIDPDAFVARVRALYDQPEEQSFDVLEFKDGRVFERASRPQRQGDEVVGRVWSFRDVTERRRADLERGRLLTEAQQAVLVRDDFLSVASHELRTPLTSLTLALQSLKRFASLPGGLPANPAPVVATLVDTAERQTRALDRLVSELLSVSRIQAGRLELSPEEMDLAGVVRDVLLDLAEDVARRGATVGVSAPGAVPGNWDRLRMAQVVTNLVVNALRYGEGKPVEVFVDAIVTGGARLRVRDQGMGIALDQQRRIFDRFERGVPSSHYGGLGLGLFIVRQIVEAHGGTVTVESAPGHGATFIVELPPLATLATTDCGTAS